MASFEQFLQRFLDSFLELFLDVLPFFAVGVLLAGILRAFDDRMPLRGRLGDSFVAILVGAGLGCIVPVCSCGVVPVALGLLSGGLSAGPVFAFLAAAPMVNPASFVMTAGVLGNEIAAARLVGAFLLATGIGLLGRRWGSRGIVRAERTSAGACCDSGECCPEGSCCPDGACCSEEDGCRQGTCCPDGACCAPGPAGTEACCPTTIQKPEGLAARCAQALYHGGETFVALFRFVLLGVALGAILDVLLRPELVADYLGGFFSIPLAALAGVPLYVCSCAEVPIALSLLRKGLDPSAILTFLLAGPGISVFSLVMLGSILRPRVLLYYATVFLAGSMAIGWLGRWLLS